MKQPRASEAVILSGPEDNPSFKPAIDFIAHYTSQEIKIGQIKQQLNRNQAFKAKQMQSIMLKEAAISQALAANFDDTTRISTSRKSSVLVSNETQSAIRQLIGRFDKRRRTEH